MALPVSGTISLNQVNTELGMSGVISLNDTNVRTLAAVPSGIIGLDDLHGKANAFTANIAGGSNLNLRTAANAAGYDGINLNVNLTITSVCTASATSVPALDLGTWPAGTNLNVTINANIIGYGGAGGAGGVNGSASGKAGGAGGPAMKANAITSGTITVTLGVSGAVRGGGGGGGGGGLGSSSDPQGGTTYYGGGPGGRGAGTQGTTGAAGVNPPDSLAGTGGTGGAYGTVGGTGSTGKNPGGTGGAGGAALVNSSLVTEVNWAGKYSGALA